MTEQEQVNALWDFQGADSELERELVTANLTRVAAYQGGGIHASDVYETVLETGRVAYFKPANGLANPVGGRALRNYGHTPLSTTISECAAWQTAKILGRPWTNLLAPTALRFVTLPDGTRDVGSLNAYRPGREKVRAFLDAVPDQAMAGAFFDALIGQQDRNDGNVLWYEERRRLYLIDHGFSFARPGANSGEVLLTNWRAGQRARQLIGSELQALRLARDFAPLEAFVELERLEALRKRSSTMRDSQQMPLVGSL